jgi:hypothetical protein
MGWYFFTALICVNLWDLAWAYPTPVDFEGDIQRWDISLSDPVVYYYVSEPEAAADDQDTYDFYIDQAAEKWTNVESSYMVLERVAEESEANIIINLKEEIDQSAFSSGFATYTKEGKKLVLCEIDVMKGTSIGIEDFSKTILHEMGHCLGLGHSLIPEAIMSYQLESNRFNLDLDDQAGVSRLYPADGSTPKIPKGCSVDRRGRESPLTILLFMLPLFFVAKKREDGTFPSPRKA